MKLKVGDKAPPFKGLTTTGQEISLSDFNGKKLVMYFYPMDDTPGCTKQACSLRDRESEIRAKGAEILGVSTQDEKSHQKFTEKYSLNFPLLADIDGQIAKSYGAMGNGVLGLVKSLVGVADRVTFIIDENGLISEIIDSPSTAKHAEEVLQRL